MQTDNSSFLTRLTIDKTCLVALFIFVLIISPLMALDEASAELITFGDYPVDTTITDQYRGLGVVFSGEPQPPIIYPPFWLETKQNELALMGADRYADGSGWGSYPFTVSFVDPTDGTPVEANNVGFYYYLVVSWSRLYCDDHVLRHEWRPHQSSRSRAGWQSSYSA